MLAGSRWVYEGETDGEAERVEIIVTAEHKTVMGIDATVVRDSVYVDDELVEDTYDWFAQDRDGQRLVPRRGLQGATRTATWSAPRARGRPASTGPCPGSSCRPSPPVGDAFRQEYYPGEAEDMVEIIDVGGSVEVPAGSFDDVVTTKDWTPLEPDVIEQKQYAPGVGKIAEAQGRRRRERQ